VYATQWAINQQMATAAKARFPERLHIVRLEDVVANSRQALRPLCEALGIDPEHPSLGAPSWNGRGLDQVYPWGTIRSPTPEANRATAAELSTAEQEEIGRIVGPWIGLLGYGDFLSS
jgi:hypothetical protein